MTTPVDGKASDLAKIHVSPGKSRYSPARVAGIAVKRPKCAAPLVPGRKAVLKKGFVKQERNKRKNVEPATVERGSGSVTRPAIGDPGVVA